MFEKLIQIIIVYTYTQNPNPNPNPNPNFTAAEPKPTSINGQKITDKNIVNAVEILKRNITRKTKSNFPHGKKKWYLKKKVLSIFSIS